MIDFMVKIIIKHDFLIDFLVTHNALQVWLNR